MESGKKSLEELTTAGVFHVPAYQRYYSWKKPEWDDLWTDLFNLPSGKQHYFGTIIIQKTDETVTGGDASGYGTSAEKRVNLLIDGQQRLTSLALLVTAMTECLAELAPSTAHEDEIVADVTEMRETFLCDHNIYQLELLDEEDNEYLQRIIDGRNVPEPERPSQRKMVDAKAYFDAQLADLVESADGDLVGVANSIKQLWQTIVELELMVYVVDADNPEKATLIFDSVNDRGRSLSTFDKTKSFLMRTAYLAAPDEPTAHTVIQRIRQAFGKMYSYHQEMLESPYVGGISDDAVQRYHFISFFDWSDSDQHSDPTFLTELKTRIRELRLEDPEACLEYIQEYTADLERGFNALSDVLAYRGDDEIASLIDRIHRLRHARKFYPLVLKAWPGLSNDERLELLDAIETYIFRVYSIGNHPSHTGESSLYIRARDIGADSPIDVWVSRLVNVMNRYEDDAQFRRSAAATDLYSKASSQDLRYFFYFLNRHRAATEGERGGPSLAEAMGSEYTVEHIWPQSPEELPLTDGGEYPSPEARYNGNVHRLGNLTLASRSWNSSWGNCSFETKHSKGYGNSQLWVQTDIQDQYDEWSIANLEDREKQLIEFMLEKWATPETRFGGIDDPATAVAALTEMERVVLKALCQNPDGAIRRDIHADASTVPDSPFTNPNVNGDERSDVGSILSRLRSVGLADRNKYTWYPTEDAQAVDIS